jgi:hypothetical protein
MAAGAALEAARFGAALAAASASLLLLVHNSICTISHGTAGHNMHQQLRQRCVILSPAAKHLLSSLSLGVSTAWPALSLRRLASPFRLRGWCCAATAATAAAATAVRGGPSGGAAGSAAL